VGDTLPALEMPVTQDWVASHIETTQDATPWYVDRSPFGGPIAPPTLTGADFDRFLRTNVFEMSGIIPTGTSQEYFSPVMVGSTVTVTCQVVERFERKGRDYVTFEFVTSDPTGKVLMKKRNTYLQMPEVAKEDR
jgi:acyl dehydratase